MLARVLNPLAPAAAFCLPLPVWRTLALALALALCDARRVQGFDKQGLIRKRGEQYSALVAVWAACGAPPPASAGVSE